MNLIDAIILGIVEGITEFLPVSSTGHLILASDLLGISGDPFTKSFEVIIQLGAILAVVCIYWKTLLSNKGLTLKVLLAFIPTAIVGLLLYPYIKEHLLGNTGVVVASLAIGGVALIVFEKMKGRKEDSNPTVGSISTKQALFVGVFQSIAVIPGVSRSAATIVGGEIAGLSRTAIVEFSFLLAIPTMIAATGLDLVSQPAMFTGEQTVLLAVGFIVSFLVALAAIRTFLAYIQKHSFVAFGAYRILLAIIFFLVFMR